MRRLSEVKPQARHRTRSVLLSFLQELFALISFQSLPVLGIELRTSDRTPSFHSHSREPVFRPGLDARGASIFERRCHLSREFAPKGLSSQHAQSPSDVGVRSFPSTEIFVFRPPFSAAFNRSVSPNPRYPTAGKAFHFSPVFHIRCSTTASFRATATIARLRAFLPPRSEYFKPHCRNAESVPNGPKI